MAKKAAASTNEIVPIQEIRDWVVILKDGSLRSVLKVGSMNFNLKSDDEQRAIVAAFQDFLNGLDFSLQIVVSSRKLNLNAYIKSVEVAVQNAPNELLQIQGTEYMRFIGGLSELSSIVSKHFYIVVPFYIAAAAVSDSEMGFSKKMRSLFSPSSVTKNIGDEELQKYANQLQQRVDVVAGGISGLGLNVQTMGYNDLLTLYYQYYNPEQTASPSDNKTYA